MKVLITAGGTGGHLFPAEKLGDDLIKMGATVLIAGYGLKKSSLFQKGFPYKDIQAANPKNPIQFFVKTIFGIFQTVKLFFSFSPDVVIGFGSFHTFPVLVTCVLFRKKIILFEANTVMGKVNRFFAPFAAKIAGFFPINEKIELVSLLPWSKNAISKEEALKAYGMDQNRFTILVFGGSQGSAFFNELMPEIAKKLDVQWIHLTGIGKRTAYSACIKEFETNMENAYAAADMVISRCGASTLIELIRNKKPSILIPFPFSSDGHQEKNGRFVASRAIGFRFMLEEVTTPEKILKEIHYIQDNLEVLKGSFMNLDLGERPRLSEVVF